MNLEPSGWRIQPGPEWPFTVEERLGRLVAHGERDRAAMNDLRQEVQRVGGQVEVLGARISGQLQSEFQALRAEQAAQAASASASPSFPIRWILTGAALAAAVLVGIGAEMGAQWRPSDTIDTVKGVAE